MCNKYMRIYALIWYHLYIYHSGGEKLANTLKKLCHWKYITNQSRNFTNCCKEFQNQKKRALRYDHLPPNNIAENEMTPWNTVHIELIGPYTVKFKQTQPGGSIKEVDFHITCMAFIDPSTG